MPARSLLLTAPHQLTWIEPPLPPLQPDQVLIETHAGAISIGTELPQFQGTARSSIPPTYPRMTGYESVGIVIERGVAVQNLEIGQRIVASYGHRTHAIIPAEKAIPIPDDISDAEAILAILTCDVINGINKLDAHASYEEDTYLISGAGCIGLLTVFMLRFTHKGYGGIDVMEPRENRCELALAFGADHAFSPDEIRAQSKSYPYAIECSSRDEAFQLLQQKMEHYGCLSILADGNLEPLTLLPEFHAKELVIAGSSDGIDYPGHAQWFFAGLKTFPNREVLARLFELHISSDELIPTFEQLASGDVSPVKVLVRY